MTDVTMGIPAGAVEDVATLVREFREREQAAATEAKAAKANARRIARARHGTPWVAEKASYCPMCAVEIEPGDHCVMMDNYHPWTRRARPDAFCPDCAEARGFGVPTPPDS